MFNWFDKKKSESIETLTKIELTPRAVLNEEKVKAAFDECLQAAYKDKISYLVEKALVESVSHLNGERRDTWLAYQKYGNQKLSPGGVETLLEEFPKACLQGSFEYYSDHAEGYWKCIATPQVSVQDIISLLVSEYLQEPDSTEDKADAPIG